MHGHQYEGTCSSCHGKKLAAPEVAYRFLHPYIRRGGAESDLRLLDPMELHASTSPLVQMLKKGHHGARLSETGWKQLYTWIDLNCPFYGKWAPKPFKTDHFVQGCTDQVARRKALNRAYADLADDPEAEYDRYAALVAARGPLPSISPSPAPKAVPASPEGRTAFGLSTPVSEVMTAKPLFIRDDAYAVDLLKVFERRRIDDLPVCDAAGRVLGVVDIQDLPKMKVL